MQASVKGHAKAARNIVRLGVLNRMCQRGGARPKPNILPAG